MHTPDHQGHPSPLLLSGWMAVTAAFPHPLYLECRQSTRLIRCRALVIKGTSPHICTHAGCGSNPVRGNCGLTLQPIHESLSSNIQGCITGKKADAMLKEDVSRLAEVDLALVSITENGTDQRLYNHDTPYHRHFDSMILVHIGNGCTETCKLAIATLSPHA
jgi:hypothetical protein